jgi:conserved domain protein
VIIIFLSIIYLGVCKLENKLEDYQLRFIDEYRQLKERCIKLRKLLTKYDAGVLDFTPKCNADILGQQLEYMDNYLYILEVRAEIEGVDLSKYL